MNKEQLAAMLDGREYGNEITSAESLIAKENGLVVVFGYSDDNCEFVGAIDEEYGCWDGGDIYFSKDGEVWNDKPNYHAKNHIRAIWCPKDEKGKIVASWAYDTELPISTFNIYEDGELYCIGIVFSTDDLK